MSGRRKFSELEKRMPPARRARIARLAGRLEEQMELKNTNVTLTQRKKKSVSCSTAPVATDPKEEKAAGKA